MKNKIAQFEALFNYATVGIIVTDHSGTIINFNKFAESQFGYVRDEVVGKPVEMLIPQNLYHDQIGHGKDFFVHPETRRMDNGRDLYALKKDGIQFPVEVSLSNYLIDEETFVNAFVVDITVRKQSETLALQKNEELARASRDIWELYSQLEQKVEERTILLRKTLAALEQSKLELSKALESEKELSELKSRFVTTASHEFRTPLSTILSSAYLLGKYGPDEYEEKKEKHIQRIKKAVEGMKENLDDFISLGKLEDGMVHVKIEELESGLCVTEIQAMVGEMEHLFRPGQKISIEHSLDWPTFQIDMHLLKSILINLLSNAIKFSGENMLIRICLKLSKEEFNLSVEDTGIGISLDDQQHLFERFFRARNAAEVQGSGLGLHIIARYIDLLHGTIKIKSALDKGSCFTLNIPQPIL